MEQRDKHTPRGDTEEFLTVLQKDMHHNIRNSLHAIIIVTEALGKLAHTSPEIQSYVERIRQQTHSIKQYMDSLPEIIARLSREKNR